MILLLLLGLPIAFSIGIAGLLGIWITTSGNWNTLIGIVGLTTYGSVATYVLTTIPMFILMAFLASAGGLAKDLYNAADKWLSHIRGGLAVGTVFACGVFGAMSGVSSAAASVMSEIAVPNMRRLGYSDVLSAGTVGVGATLDVLIPPSVGLVIYGLVTETSIGKLLIAGVLPGVILGIFLILCIALWVIIRPEDAPKAQPAPWSERWQSIWPVWPSLLLIMVVIGLLYMGICTPTEVGALGAFVAGVIGIAMGRLTWKGVLDSCRATLRITAMIFMILIGTFIFSAFVALSGIPDTIIAAVSAWNLNRWIVIIGIILIYFGLSMFMDELPLLLLTLGLSFPLITKLGFDPIWFGVVSMLMVMMGLVFPPVGMLAFVVSSTAKIDLMKVYKGTSILMIAIIMTLILVMLFPQTATWLPSRML
jgi:tripartite ATP-independent transporter DctM subunit